MSKQTFCPHTLCRPAGHGGASLSTGVNLKPGPGQVGWAGTAPEVANRQPRQPAQLPFSPEVAPPLTWAPQVQSTSVGGGHSHALPFPSRLPSVSSAV